MTELYHSKPQALRIQKRLVLNRCFKLVREHANAVADLTYVTFGGEDLYDVMDLLCVFDISSIDLRVISYEVDRDIARKAQKCAVARTLSKVKSVDILIRATDFPTSIEETTRKRNRERF